MNARRGGWAVWFAFATLFVTVFGPALVNDAPVVLLDEGWRFPALAEIAGGPQRARDGSTWAEWSRAQKDANFAMWPLWRQDAVIFSRAVFSQPRRRSPRLPHQQSPQMVTRRF